VHVPVSRVEPFTLVYNSANTMMDGLFKGLRSVIIVFPQALILRDSRPCENPGFLLRFLGIASHRRNLESSRRGHPLNDSLSIRYSINRWITKVPPLPSWL